MKYYFLLIVLAAHTLYGQSAADRNEWKRGLAYLQIGEYYNAIKSFKNVTHSKYFEGRAFVKIGDCYRQLRDFKKALQSYETAMKKGAVSDSLLNSYGEVLKGVERYDDAKKSFSKIRNEKKDAFGVQQKIASCDSSAKWKSNPGAFRIENLRGINSEYSEISPAEFHDKIVFSSNREGTIIKDKSNQTGQPYYNLWKASRDADGNFKGVLPFSAKVNSGYHDFAPSFTENYDTVYFTRSFAGKNDKASRLKLYCAENQKVGWSQAYRFVLNDSACSYACPFIDKDEKLFFFSSDMPDGYGGSDLYVCLKVDSLWTDPINLGPEINTAGNEFYPCFRNDRLYFSSDGHTGMGGFDIFSVTYSNGKWKNLKNAGYPLNTGADDYALSLSVDKTVGYFTSNRSGGEGSNDIYKVILEEGF
jgi:tetratricopeptide (TPR) repeat protein